MDDELEELEFLLSEHFGRTPLNTPAASQTLPDSTDSDDDDNTADVTSEVDVDERTRQFIREANGINETSSSDENDDTENDGNILNCVPLPDDDPDLVKIRAIFDTGCGCRHKCTETLDKNEMYTHILNMREMSREEKDMYIMGSLLENNEGNTTRGKKRVRSSHVFMFSGRKVCKKIFLLCYDIGKKALQNISSHVKIHGVASRSHGNTGNKPRHALKFEEVKMVVQFISNYADEFGLPQPAAPRGQDGVPPIYIPSDNTKKNIHEKYIESCELQRSVKYSTFCNIWNHCLPHIKIAKPQDDVCATCEKIRKCILDSITEEDKLDATSRMREHILHAQEERDTYNSSVKLARETDGLQGDQRHIHYTFDFSQNVCLPHHSRQMGPLYFLSLRKIHIFGFRLDGEPRQLNFLINEDETIGTDGANVHGPDSVISMVDWALQNHHSNESKCIIHADNCAGQNKNQYVLGYFMWRVMTGQHFQIDYKMQVPGHARCLIDGGFALIKKLYRRMDCDSIGQLEDVVNKSSSTNSAVRYPAWQWRAWKKFLTQFFKPLKGIRQYQHFSFNADEPGVVTLKKTSSGEETKVKILKVRNHTFDTIVRPDIVQPSGLSETRRGYLYNSVRRYVRPAFQDDTCPAQ